MSYKLLRDGRVIFLASSADDTVKVHVEDFGPTAELTLCLPHGNLAVELGRLDLLALAAWINDHFEESQ